MKCARKLYTKNPDMHHSRSTLNTYHCRSTLSPNSIINFLVQTLTCIEIHHLSHNNLLCPSLPEAVCTCSDIETLNSPCFLSDCFLSVPPLSLCISFSYLCILATVSVMFLSMSTSSLSSSCLRDSERVDSSSCCKSVFLCNQTKVNA